MTVSGQFVDSARGRILLVCHKPASDCTGAVVVFPPLAEEMNKSRRLVWSLGQQLAEQGLMTVVPDLYGTGDSTGDFGEATWAGWCEDMRTAIEWARDNSVGTCHALLVRLGACLYSSCASNLDTGQAHRVVAWQPEYSGEVALRQLLRLKVMSDRVTWGEKTTLGQLDKQLQTSALEIGGYTYSTALARAIRTAEFTWEDLAANARGVFFDWAKAPVEDSAEGATRVQRIQSEGQRFWTAVEPGPNPLLVQKTADFFTADA